MSELLTPSQKSLAHSGTPAWAGRDIWGWLPGRATKSLVGTAGWKLALALLLLGGVLGLLAHSLYLAAMRIYQVDECMEVYVARVLAGAGDKSAAGHATLFQVLLSFCLRGGAAAAECLASARLAMVILFWVNWLLLACATGARLLSLRWLAALAGAATLAPLWDYGFEVRHDNLLLAGVLGMWCLARFGRVNLGASLALGVATALLQFVAFKSFAYTVPLSLAALAFPRAEAKLPRWKLALTWAAGAGGAFLTIRFAFGAAGLWQLYENNFQFLSTASSHGHRFGPGLALTRLFHQTPLLLALVAAGSVSVGLDFWRRGRAALTWESSLPEFLLFSGAFGILLINPAPYPYNLLHLAPYAFLFAVRYAEAIFSELRAAPGLLPLAAAVVVFAHVVPFAIATARHQNYPNSRQELIMSLAEDATDSVKDPVFDAVGLVSSRPIIDNRSFLHGLDLESFLHGPGPQIRDLLTQRPAAVIVCNYRTDWLPAKDQEFISDRYVSLADDFWVLGKVLPPGGGAVDIFHSGRYRLTTLPNSHLAGTYTNSLQSMAAPETETPLDGTLDGAKPTAAPLELTVGRHVIACDSNCQPALVWVGPKVDRLPRIAQQDHRRLFVNWY